MKSEIKLINLTLQDRTSRKTVTYYLENVVWIDRKNNMLLMKNNLDRQIINKTKSKNDLHVVKVEVIKVVGKSNVY
jgi:hypothetical protein